MSMEKIDKKIEAEKRLHEEMQHRKNVEEEAHELICQCRFEEAVALLAMLDDSIVKELAEIVEADGGVTAKVENEREQRQCEEMEAEGKEDMERRDDAWLAKVEIKGDTDGRAQIYIDGKQVHGVIGYRIEHNSSDKRVPHLILEIQCSLEMESGAIPVLPEPWTWFYEPKLPNFVDERDYLSSLSGTGGEKR